MTLNLVNKLFAIVLPEIIDIHLQAPERYPRALLSELHTLVSLLSENIKVMGEQVRRNFWIHRNFDPLLNTIF
uniref:Uncharacterized protein n=1 Tax=Arundo donax TaxID=35708 RepID=A0A0A8Z1L6_ARUDO